MNEKFILPRYWVLKITDENREVIQKWRKLVFNFDNDISYWSYIDESGWWGERGRGMGGEMLIETRIFITHVYAPLFNTQSVINEDYSYLIPFIQKLNLNTL